MNVALRYPPRLARLYSADVKRLEALHAGRLSPGVTTWSEAVEALYGRVHAAGPAKGARLIRQAADYLCGTGRDERIHLVLTAGTASNRNAHLMFFTFSIGPHPDPVVEEDGLTISMHIIQCARSRPVWSSGVPVAYISRHAIKRLYERNHEIVENVDASSLFAFVGTLGYLVHSCDRHRDGGLHMLFDDTLMAGGQHRFTKVYPGGHAFEERFFDVRTVLLADEIGPHRQCQLEQGDIATAAVLGWFRDADGLATAELAELIPCLPRREDHYPLRAARSI
jgi:hypothetical protein